ncbi:MAG: MFS transporter [Chlamydiales bacterium]|nr:MFS transporter [Chlamydiales bacterium]
MSTETIESREKPERGCSKTRLALLWMNLSSEPLTALYTLLPFILRKDLHATLFQISLFVMLKPVLSVFSFYWSAYISNRREKLRSNLIGAWVLARLPFLLLPLIDNVWFLLLAASCYQLFSRASNPALIEILKLNIPKAPREKAFSFYYVLSFIESVALGLAIGDVLDGSVGYWRVLFLLASVVGLSSILFQMRIPIPKNESEIAGSPPLKRSLIAPWKECFALLKARPDFAHFQWGFMIGGFGLMLIAPSLSIFYSDVLALTHGDIAIARFVLMGIGVALSSFLWRRGIEKIQIPKLTSWILIGFALFPLALLFAPYSKLFVYLAFFIYGIAQAGSHLLWNLSGTLFSKEGDSLPFSTTNILMVGIRGAVGPLLGGILCDLFGPSAMLSCGVLIALYGSLRMIRTKKPSPELS